LDKIGIGGIVGCGVSIAAPGDEVSYSMGVYRSLGTTHPSGPGVLGTLLDTWILTRDASCTATHPSAKRFCNDRIHVLLNHVSTPFFVRQDLSDPNHLNTGTGWIVDWIDANNVFGGPATPSRFDPAQFHDRVKAQAEAMSSFDVANLAGRSLFGNSAMSGAASETDVSSLPVIEPGVFIDNCGVHESIKKSTFHDVEMKKWDPVAMQFINPPITFHDALLSWMDNGNASEIANGAPIDDCSSGVLCGGADWQSFDTVGGSYCD